MTREEVVDKVRENVRDLEENAKARLLNGYYKSIEGLFEHWEVDGDKIELRDTHDNFDPRAVIEYGDFGGFFFTQMEKLHEVNLV